VRQGWLRRAGEYTSSFFYGNVNENQELRAGFVHKGTIQELRWPSLLVIRCPT
jgi:hypothetical protein